LAVEPSLRVERREELVWLLVQAAELEHGLMCEYLFAQFTLKRSTDEATAARRSRSRCLIDAVVSAPVVWCRRSTSTTRQTRPRSCSGDFHDHVSPR
jgi:hypothetical protein